MTPYTKNMLRDARKMWLGILFYLAFFGLAAFLLLAPQTKPRFYVPTTTTR